MTGVSIAFACIVAVLSFGFLVPFVMFRLRDVLSLTAMAVLLGTAFLLVMANALSFVTPTGAAFATVIGVMAVVDIVLLIRWSKQGHVITFDASEKLACTVLGAFGIVSALACARFVGSDPWSWQHFPLASTIIAGNFPVMSPIDPLHPLYYHYAPAFLAAGFRFLTGLSLSVGFALQPAFGAFGILFAVAAFVRRSHASFRTAVACGLLALAGTGLTWLRVLDWHGYATFWEMVSSPITTSPLIFLGHRSTALGFPLLFGLVWCISCALDGYMHERRFAALAGFFFALALALSMEMALATLSAAAAMTAFLLLLSPTTRANGVRLTAFGLSALVPALMLSFVQGGVLSGLTSGGHTFAFHPSFVITIDTFGSTVVPWSVQFLRDFGLPLLLFPLAFIGAVRRFRTQPLWMMLCILGLIHFLLPFTFEYHLIKGEMRRAFYVSTSVFSLLAGLTVSDLFLVSKKRSYTTIGFALIAVMLLPSCLYLALRIVIPTGRLESAPLFAGMPTITESQKKLYEWVEAHTTQKDFFYVRNLTVNFEDLSEEEMQMRDRILFTTYTGRFTVGPIIFWDYDKDWLNDVLTAERTCATDVMRKLGVGYILVLDSVRAEWFQDRCRSSDWILRYGDKELPSVYQLKAAETVR